MITRPGVAIALAGVWAVITVTVIVVAWRDAKAADRREAMYARANNRKQSEILNTRTASTLGGDALAVRQQPLQGGT